MNLSYLYLVPPLGVTRLEFRGDFWKQKTGVPIIRHCLRDLMFSHFGTIPVCDMDGRTQDDII